jgi:hypothetical protein
MVTRRTGRPRGRPRKPARPQRNVGRPRLRLIDDTDKHAVACLDALVALEFGTEHACAMGVIALFVGIKGEADTLSADGRHVVTNWERYRTRHGSNAGTLEGRAGTLRGKRRKYQSKADLHWRAAMSAAFRAVFTLADRQQSKCVALAAAMIVDEAEFARAKLWPMIDARFSGQFRINAGEPELV